jgi:hypothetical protein
VDESSHLIGVIGWWWIRALLLAQECAELTLILGDPDAFDDFRRVEHSSDRSEVLKVTCRIPTGWIEQ